MIDIRVRGREGQTIGQGDLAKRRGDLAGGSGRKRA